MIRRATLAILAALSLLLLACAPDPNRVCEGHGGVRRVNQNGNRVTGIVCRDGFWKAGERW